MQCYISARFYVYFLFNETRAGSTLNANYPGHRAATGIAEKNKAMSFGSCQIIHFGTSQAAAGLRLKGGSDYSSV